MATKTIRLSNGTDKLLPESAESGTGYCKLADGTLIQWGENIIAATNSKVHITFPISFINAAYAMCALPLFNSTRAVSCVVAGQVATGMDIYRSSNDLSSTQQIYWLAIGRWK